MSEQDKVDADTADRLLRFPISKLWNVAYRRYKGKSVSCRAPWRSWLADLEDRGVEDIGDIVSRGMRKTDQALQAAILNSLSPQSARSPNVRSNIRKILWRDVETVLALEGALQDTWEHPKRILRDRLRSASASKSHSRKAIRDKLVHWSEETEIALSQLSPTPTVSVDRSSTDTTVTPSKKPNKPAADEVNTGPTIYVQSLKQPCPLNRLQSCPVKAERIFTASGLDPRPTIHHDPDTRSILESVTLELNELKRFCQSQKDNTTQLENRLQSLEYLIRQQLAKK